MQLPADGSAEHHRCCRAAGDAFAVSSQSMKALWLQTCGLTDAFRRSRREHRIPWVEPKGSSLCNTVHHLTRQWTLLQHAISTSLLPERKQIAPLEYETLACTEGHLLTQHTSLMGWTGCRRGGAAIHDPDLYIVSHHQWCCVILPYCASQSLDLAQNVRDAGVSFWMAGHTGTFPGEHIGTRKEGRMH